MFDFGIVSGGTGLFFGFDDCFIDLGILCFGFANRR